VGAGPVGCVVAERAASELGWSVLVVERRQHTAGNCYDRYHESGIFIQQYGPHYYRTDSESQFLYLSRFTEWIPGHYVVKARTYGQLFPFPINLDTLEQFFGKPLTPTTARKLLDALRLPIASPSNSEEFVLSTVGKELYEAFFLGYTAKHWGQHPTELDASVCARIPVRLNRDPRYVTHRFQVLPKYGYTRLFNAMLQHPRIKLLLNCDYREIVPFMAPRKATVYCGPLDEYFDYSLGKLQYRSVVYEYEVIEAQYAQPCVQINYPNDYLYTRSIEYKHLTRQRVPHTLLAYEFPMPGGEPFYPVPSAATERMAENYRTMAMHERDSSRVYFAGRLAEYRYYNMDQAIERGISIFHDISGTVNLEYSTQAEE
jgi:UDP-galactopyranose mutase